MFSLIDLPVKTLLSSSDIVKRKKLRIDFVELYILAKAAVEPFYGLRMIEQLGQQGYKAGPSQLYPKLHRLEHDGHLKRTDQLVGGKFRKYYEITPSGLTYLRQEKIRLARLTAEALSPEEINEMLNTDSRRREGNKT
jgi:DNA-binding PadR family transcriptional regulator